MEAHPGDVIEVHFEGDRFPKMVGVVRAVYGENAVTKGLLVVERTDDGRIACIPASLDIQIIKPGPV